MTVSKTIVFEVPTRSGGTSDGRVEATTRGDAELVKLAAVVGEDAVELELVNGPTLVLHPEHARELFAAQGGPARSANETSVRVPTRLGWTPSDVDRTHGRGTNELGQVVVRAFKVLKETLASKGANWVAREAAKSLDGRVSPGLRRLTTAPVWSRAPEEGLTPSDKPLLVLLHGTFSTTHDTFGKLWDHPSSIADMLARFDAYGFDHPSLTQSPLNNALELAKLLPEGAEVSFLTHSRGGLVAEALAQLTGGKPTGAAWFDAEKYAEQREELKQLADLVAARRLKVKRIVRVACPARGTLLASKRLDVYLSILTWGLKLAQVPVAPALVDFLGEVAKRRTKPDELPGLEAMMPESDFIGWLNGSDGDIPGELRVVAGDVQGDSLLSWLKTLVSDAFYWTDNDFVVQTRSMYGARPRAGGSLFFLERGGKVDHFSYFANRSTALAITRAVTDDRPEGFEPIGRLSREGRSSTGGRAASLTDVLEKSKSKSKPAVIVVPGILGSELSIGSELLWLSLHIINGLPRLAYREPSDVTASGWLGLFYDDLARHLADSHEVIPFYFDWRKPIEEEAAGLAKLIAEALAERNQPVRIIAHSLGALVARVVEKVAPEVWRDFMTRDRSRFVMLAPPNGGSWAPMQVLSGDNLIGNLIAYVGTLFREHEARGLFAALPGFVELQAGLLDPELRLAERPTWERLAKVDRERWEKASPWHNLEIQRRNLDWGIPAQPVLDTARALHAWLEQQDLQQRGNRVVIVVGKADETPAGYESEPSFNYLKTDRGDGTVTLADALLPGVRAFQVDVEHSQLPRHGELFDGYLSLLEDGTPNDPQHFTSLLSMRGREAMSVRAAPERLQPAARQRGFSEDELDASVTLTLTSPATATSSSVVAPALKINVTNGDLTFVDQPLMLGHYRSLVLTGAEKVIDDFLGNTMTLALRLREYPTLPGQAHTFENQLRDPKDPHAVPRPPAVIVVGLGAEGELRAEELCATVRQGVIHHALRLAEDPKHGTSFELAATFIGSGGMGIPVATSARAVAQGVYAANQRLLEQNAPIVSKLCFIEVYEDRATEALRELLTIARQKPAAFDVERWLQTGTRPLVRPLTSSYRGADYDMISVLDGPLQNGKSSIVFALDTRRARTEVRSTTSQLPLLQALVDQAQADRHGDSKLGKTLYRMLVPSELDSYFVGCEGVVLRVDGATAGVPWELLGIDDEDAQANDCPWSIRAKLVRKLQTQQFRENPKAAGETAKPMVIGDPFIDDRAQYPALPGAVREARAVGKVFGVEPRLGEKAVALVNALLAEEPSILHIAGHGKEDGSGVVMSGDLVLGADLVKGMRRLPELVFVNTCHSARQRLGQLPQQAATLARALIEAGVKCVIATGWAVDDDAAEHFAAKLYEGLLGQETFMAATSAARESTWRAFPHSNTWAAYQCYGDPDWMWLRQRPVVGAGTPATAQTRPLEAETPIVSPAELVIALKTLGVRAASKETRDRALERACELEAELGQRFATRGEVAEAFADAFNSMKLTEHAITWYERAARAESGATFRSLEQLFNLKVRASADAVERAYLEWERTEDLAKAGAAASFREKIAGAAHAFDDNPQRLEHIATLPQTSERMSLLGSAWKRRAMIAYADKAMGNASAGDQLLTALERSRRYYQLGAALAAKEQAKNVGYARLNAMTVKLVLELVAGTPPIIDEAAITEVRSSLKAWADDKTDFWPHVQAIEIDVFEGVCRSDLARRSERIAAAFAELWQRMSKQNEWDSVRNQACFLFRPYRETASPGERSATERLRQQLDEYAGKA